MNFSFEGMDETIAIKGYKIKGDSIIICFLDGGTYEAKIDDESIIISEMITQATQREKSEILKKEQIKLRKGLTRVVIGSFPVTGAIIYNNISNNDNNFMRIISFVIGIFSGAMVALNGIGSLSEVNRINELKKYSIYLKIRKEIESCKDENLFNNVKNKRELNINTLDNFSLREIKIIRDNLVRCKEYARILSK